MVRQTIDLQISEFNPTWEYVSFYVYLGGFLILYPLFPDPVRRLTYPSLLLLIYLYPALKHVRYFIDILLPLAFVSFGRGGLELLLSPYRRWIESWKQISRKHRATLRTLAPRRLTKKEGDHAPADQPSANLKPYLATGYLLLIGLLAIANSKQVSNLKSFQEGLSPIPRNALALSSFNLQYKTLFLRPDIRLIPSCELGFASRYIFGEYTEFFNDGKVYPLAQKTGARFFLDNRRMYINPTEGAVLEQEMENDFFTLWKISGEERRLRRPSE
jgi:hypothetical protein